MEILALIVLESSTFDINVPPKLILPLQMCLNQRNRLEDSIGSLMLWLGLVLKSIAPGPCFYIVKFTQLNSWESGDTSEHRAGMVLVQKFQPS